MGDISLVAETGDGTADPIGRRQAYCPVEGGFLTMRFMSVPIFRRVSNAVGRHRARE